MSRTIRFKIDYVGGVWQATKPKKGSASVDKSGFTVEIGSMGMGDRYFIPWGCIVAINLTGSLNPAFQSVPRYLTGIPGLQTVSTKSVSTGAKCFMAVAYTGIQRMNFPKAAHQHPNTLQMYALDMNQSDVETHLAQYMHIVDHNAQQYAARTAAASRTKSTSRRVNSSVIDHDEDVMDDEGEDDATIRAGRSRKASPSEISKSLKELATLYKDGLLTKKEFEQAKKKLLQ
jgi:hypothetical protein